MSFGLTDEIFAVAASKPAPVGPSYFYGLMTLPYVGWAGGTLLGALAGSILPDRFRLALGIMIYAMFIAIILPPMKRDKGVLGVVLLAAALSCCVAFLPFLKWISAGFAIILCAVIAAAVLALVCPIAEDDEEEETS